MQKMPKYGLGCKAEGNLPLLAVESFFTKRNKVSLWELPWLRVPVRVF
jgi:hypothetical protein